MPVRGDGGRVEKVDCSDRQASARLWLVGLATTAPAGVLLTWVVVVLFRCMMMDFRGPSSAMRFLSMASVAWLFLIARVKLALWTVVVVVGAAIARLSLFCRV